MKRLKKHKQGLETAEVSTRRLRNGTSGTVWTIMLIIYSPVYPLLLSP